MKMLLTFTLAGICLISAQEAPNIDLVARRESVETLRQHITMRQKRLDEVAGEIRERGQKTDKAIENLVKQLSTTKDSQDSKRGISMVKVEAVVALKRMISVYGTERAKVAARLSGDSSVPVELLNKNLKTLDALIEKRAADIVELVKSMPGSEDVAKYEHDSDYYRNGVYYENSRISEAWRQNRRDKVQSEKLRRETQQALDKAIANLNSRRDALQAAVSATGISDSEKEIQQQELDHVSNLLEQRKGQLSEIMTPSPSPAEAASKDEAEDMKELFSDARNDIAGDFSKTLQLYREAVSERDKIQALQDNLEARIKWLSENDPEAKKAE
ncbi:MAG: hypothetical protein V4584_15565 [Verrucomicrobiota bacterium]